jgi:hypothetical protein
MVYSLGYNLSIPAAINQYNNIYYVENQLDFTGDLKVSGSSQGILSPGERVHTGEKITWSGLKVVFNGTNDVYPNNEYFDVTVSDDDGDSWTDKFSSGQQINIESVADLEDDNSDNHTLKITNIAGDGVGLSDHIFELQVVSTRMVFTNPIPNQNIWHDTTEVECGITISDEANWRIDGSSIEYSISTQGSSDEHFSNWLNGGEIGLQDEVTIKVTVNFANGDDNYIKWRAKNEVSDIFSGSQLFGVKVDIEPVAYTDPVPKPNEWQYKTSVECSVIIYDNLSGLDPDTVEYRFKLSGESTFSSWTKSGLTYSDITIALPSNQAIAATKFKTEILFKSGEENYIQWRGLDNNKNSAEGSEQYRIRITQDVPISILKSPSNGAEITELPLSLTWSGTDPGGKNISYELYLSTDLNKVEILDPSVRVFNSITRESINLSDLFNGKRYYWTVIPNNGELTGLCQSGVWSFTVSLPAPSVMLLVPGTNSRVATTNIEFLWRPVYSGFEQVKYDLYVGESNPPDEISIADLELNTYHIGGLVDGNTYYWYVISKIQLEGGEILEDSNPMIFKFTIDLGFSIPNVRLDTPKNNTYVTTRTPTLGWTLKLENNDDTKPSDLEFRLILSDYRSPANIITRGIINNNYTLHDTQKLDFNNSYYWRVLPYLNTQAGYVEGSMSDIWVFVVTDQSYNFKVKLDLISNKVTLSPGEEGKVKFSILNLGNGEDNIEISFVPNYEAAGIDLKIEPNRFLLPPNDEGEGDIMITIEDDVELKNYEFTIKAISENAEDYGLVVSTEDILEIKVREKEEPLNYGIIIATGMVILIVIFLIGYILVAKSRSKQKKEPEEVEPEKSELRKGVVKKNRYHTPPRKTSSQRPKPKSKSGGQIKMREKRLR